MRLKSVIKIRNARDVKNPQIILFLIVVVFFDAALKSHAAQSNSVVINSGLALGLNASLDKFFWVFIYLVAIGRLIYSQIVNRNSTLDIYLAYLLIAGVSNLYDRLMNAGVIDYLHILGIWFNLSDILISLIMLHLLFNWETIRNGERS